MFLRLQPVALTCVLLLAGCSTQAVELLPLLAHHDCRLSAGVHRVSYAQLAQLRGGILLEQEFLDAAAAEEDLLVAIALGPQPTPGYGLSLLGPGRLQDGVLSIQLQRTQPPADAILPQVITHPCLV